MLTAWLPVAGYAVLILTVSSFPDLSVPVKASHGDKLAHFVEYGVLGGLLVRALALSGPTGWPARIALGVAAGTALAAADEVYQGAVGRQASTADWVADTAGVVLVIVASAWWLNRARSER